MVCTSEVLGRKRQPPETEREREAVVSNEKDVPWRGWRLDGVRQSHSIWPPSMAAPKFRPPTSTRYEYR
jgi:hypothetical protein